MQYSYCRRKNVIENGKHKQWPACRSETHPSEFLSFPFNMKISMVYTGFEPGPSGQKSRALTTELLEHPFFGCIFVYGWMDFRGWSPARLLHAGLNSGLMCKMQMAVYSIVVLKVFTIFVDLVWNLSVFILYLRNYKFYGTKNLLSNCINCINNTNCQNLLAEKDRECEELTMLPS
jgi:hypothetical protein